MSEVSVSMRVVIHLRNSKKICVTEYSTPGKNIILEKRDSMKCNMMALTECKKNISF